ncbi:MAG: endolytic transglycosylase MltG [Candidatus Rokubacteria bacterium]|nr:endolytic transglycosylase MltG [Candidatus Rokubacteria bacterium]
MKLRLALAATGAVVGVLLAAVVYLASPTAAVRARAVIVEIPAHQGLLDVGTRLESAGVIKHRAVFAALAVVRGSARRLKAGDYEVPRGATTLDVLALIESGRVRQHIVLHPEGASVAEVARVLADERLATAADLMRAARDPAFLAAHGIPGPSVEGYLFPDTYQFVRGLKVEEILGRMILRLRAKLGDAETRAKDRGLTLHQLLTLASIIEREAVAPDERRVIAAVFWNRLKRGMPLQADPTVQYAAGRGRRTLTRADLDVDDAFNTYRYAGLPPGPIASPGLASIEAALDPAPVPYLYFVKLDERRHHFSTTVAEHNAAVARYRMNRSR